MGHGMILEAMAMEIRDGHRAQDDYGGHRGHRPIGTWDGCRGHCHGDRQVRAVHGLCSVAGSNGRSHTPWM